MSTYSDTPSILPINYSAIKVPELLTEYLRHRWRNHTPNDGTLLKITEGIWVSSGPIALHTDSTADGLITMGVVLINDGGYQLAAADRLFVLKPGTAYRINAREPHGVLQAELTGDGSCFAFLAWDVPSTMEWHEFRQDAHREIYALRDSLAPVHRRGDR